MNSEKKFYLKSLIWKELSENVSIVLFDINSGKVCSIVC